jgi:hypothetical protein
MTMTLRRVAAVAGVALAAALTPEVVGLRAFSRLVGSDVQALLARAPGSGMGVVIEEMLSGLPEPVQRYLRYSGVVGRP